MKNLLSRRALVTGVALACATLLAPAVQAQQAKLVSITSIVDHPALDAVRKGVEDELKALGWEQGKNVKVQFQSAQGNAATAGQIAKKYVGDKSDVIVAIATPSAQAAVAATKSIPVVYTAVTDPVAAKLVKSMKPSGTNVTGVSDALPLAQQIDLITKIKPGAKRVGMVYSPGEVNSTIVVKELKAGLSKRGMTLVEAAAPRTVDVGPAAKSLVGKVDVIYTNTDNNVVSTYESLVRVAADAKLPLIAADLDSVKRGAVAALGMDYYDMGRQTGKMVDRILKGTKPGDMPTEFGKKMTLMLNESAARQQGVTLSPEVRKQAAEIVK